MRSVERNRLELKRVGPIVPRSIYSRHYILYVGLPKILLFLALPGLQAGSSVDTSGGALEESRKS